MARLREEEPLGQLRIDGKQVELHVWKLLEVSFSK